MLGNTFGRVFRVTTCGESYGIGEGSGLSVIVDGVPPGLKITDAMIQKELDKRRPGQGKLDSPRKETDQVHIFAGIGQDGVTTGTPLGMIIYNVDTKQVHINQYRSYKDLIRPGHAEYTFFLKYGEAADWCGAGRASGRETVTRVAAGAVAKIILAREKIELIAYTKECMGIRAREMSWAELKRNYRKNEINCPDLKAAKAMIEKVIQIKNEGDTAGGIIELRIHNVPGGLGEPVFDKLNATLSHAICSIGAVKGIEFGDGFACARAKGSDWNDHPYLDAKGKVRFKTNHAGGVLGGISNGEDIVIRVAVKPTPTVSVPQPSINMKKMKEEILSPITRRDPTLLGRHYAVIEAMSAIALTDALFLDRGWEGMARLKQKWINLKRK
ncbi:MAG: chorismate synthase [Candidatus Hydrogenedentes bacterium CG07_land_8_20_14_0_80_42_17]|nr:MAG: chorismate synthase [Candidatus Hydrogenedentes bacterium CG1_02_42_14]PIU46688.1 MAG: chorismate synthase [Candidatus Hydrogenedentes bacterium CG07_land_8_20_14_0_80_42_17]